jgi:hypothetical protein
MIVTRQLLAAEGCVHERVYARLRTLLASRIVLGVVS